MRRHNKSNFIAIASEVVFPQYGEATAYVAFFSLFNFFTSSTRAPPNHTGLPTSTLDDSDDAVLSNEMLFGDCIDNKPHFRGYFTSQPHIFGGGNGISSKTFSRVSLHLINVGLFTGVH